MKTKKQEELALSRKKVLEKIAEYEKLARFNDDVEEDPVSPALLPDDVDYLIEKRKNKFFAININRTVSKLTVVEFTLRIIVL